jgi:integrase
MLVRVLADAVHHKLAITNIAREQPPPRAPVRKIKVPTEDAIGPMLARLEGDPFRVMVLITLLCAVRRGELLALTWRHVDLDGATL